MTDVDTLVQKYRPHVLAMMVVQLEQERNEFRDALRSLVMLEKETCAAYAEGEAGPPEIVWQASWITARRVLSKYEVPGE